ncbi:MAG: hypothetical protein Q9195_009037 [Heterodermia aff. obscurata]
MSQQNEGTITPPPPARTRSPTPQQDEPPPSHQPDPLPSPSQTLAEGGQALSNGHDTPAPEPHGTSHDAHNPHTGTSKDALSPQDWTDLEARFGARMRECQAREEELGREFAEWVEVFKAWASVTEIHEEERAAKRLRTRIAYVQQKEKKLEEKQRHYIKVVQAFETLLAMGMDLEIPTSLQREDEDIEMANRQPQGEGLGVAGSRWGRCAVM